MKLGKRRGSVTCQRAIEMVTDYLDGALPGGARRALEAHLRACPNCAEYLAQVRTTIELTGHVDSAELSSDMRNTLIALYRQTTRDATGSA
jgi:anti-sigma factor RsiW